MSSRAAEICNELLGRDTGIGRRSGPLLLVAAVFVALALAKPAPAFATQTFLGKFQYEDREFDFMGFTGRTTPRPIRFADVRIISGNSTIASGATGEDGSFFIQMPDTAPQSLKAVCVTSAAMTPALLIGVRVAENDYSFGDYYSVASAPKDTLGTGILNFGTTLATASNDAGKAFNIWDVALDSMEFIGSSQANGRLPDKKLTLIWRFDHYYSGTYYSGPVDDRYVYIGLMAAYDDTVISHEIGHYIDDCYFKSDNPGGKHYIGFDDQDIRLAWAEGLATFLGSSVRKFNGQAHPELYVSTDGINLNFSFEIEQLTSTTFIHSRTGSTNEMAVAGALWDITDGQDTRDASYGVDDDPMQRPFSDVWKVLHGYLPAITRPGISIENFWDGWFSPQINNGFAAEMRSVFADGHGIEYIPDAEEQDNTAATAMPAASGQKLHHTYYPEGDVDWYSVEAVTGENFVVETLNISNGADTVIDILAPDGVSILATNDDHGSAASYLNWTAPSGGKYYVRSRRYSGPDNFARYGSYDLRVTQIQLEPARTVLTVSRPGQGGAYASLSDAIEHASSGDTIQVLDNATYSGGLTIIGKKLTLKAAAGKSPVLDGRTTNAQPAIAIMDSPDIRIEGMIILGGAQGIAATRSNVTLINTVIAGMYADGIKITGPNSSAEIVNCTIAKNGEFGIELSDGGLATVVNTIFSDNSTDDVRGDPIAGGLTIANSLISTPPFFGSNQNVAGNPRFVDLAGSNFRLLATSPAIDRGNPGAHNLPAIDADGLPRSIDGLSSGTPVPDLGAYEFLPTGILNSAAIFPQFVSGGTQPRYQTSLIALNPGPSAAMASIALHKSNGELLPLNLPDSASLGARDSFSLSIAPMGAARLDTAGTGGLAAGFAVYLSSTPIDGTAIIKAYRENELKTEAGVALSKRTRKLVLQVNNTGNASTGYALANPGTHDARLSFALRDENGILLDSKSLLLGAGKHLAEFADQRFPLGAGPGFKGAIEVVSDEEIASIALRLDNPELDMISNFPPLADEPATDLYFPLAVDGAGYRTGILLINPSDTAIANVAVDFFGENGAALGVSINGLTQTGYEAAIEPGGVSHIFTDGPSADLKNGWARVKSSSGIGGSIILQTVAGPKITSAAGVVPSALSKHLTTYIESRNDVASGVAICNPNSTPVYITLTLRDSSGRIAASTRFELAAMGKVAKFIGGPNQWFEGFAQFEGTLEVLASSEIIGATVRYDNENAGIFTTIPMIPIGVRPGEIP